MCTKYSFGIHVIIFKSLGKKIIEEYASDINLSFKQNKIL